MIAQAAQMCNKSFNARQAGGAVSAVRVSFL